jgi:hypothetical protein
MSEFDPRRYLDTLERLVDLERVRKAEARQSAAWHCKPVDSRPTIVTVRDDWGHIQHDFPPDWPEIPYVEAFRDPAKMLVAELWRVYEGALLKDDRSYTIRANYGIVLLPSLVGCQVSQEGNDMPWASHIDRIDMLEDVLDQGIPDLGSGIGNQVWETALYFEEMLAPYQVLSETVRIGCPDAQGPFNTAVNIAGSNLYLWVVDQPDLVHRLLSFCADLYLAVISKHKQLMGEPDDVGYSFSYRIAGGGRMSDDSAVMLSGPMYRDFVVPYNTRVFQATKGGLLHFCGKGDQFFHQMAATPGVSGINFGNPEMQDFGDRYDMASKAGVCLLWDGDLDEQYRDITTGVVHKRICRSWAESEMTARQLGFF